MSPVLIVVRSALAEDKTEMMPVVGHAGRDAFPLRKAHLTRCHERPNGGVEAYPDQEASSADIARRQGQLGLMFQCTERYDPPGVIDLREARPLLCDRSRDGHSALARPIRPSSLRVRPFGRTSSAGEDHYPDSVASTPGRREVAT